MIKRIRRKRKIRNADFVEPDEIFLDSRNMPNFNLQQFEGRIEKPIGKNTIIFTGIFFILVLMIFSGRLLYLQVVKGEAYLERSEGNTLEKHIIFAERGIIYDRNNKEIAWNQQTVDTPFPARAYLSPGFSHLLGYISYPAEDKNGVFWQTEFKGLDGLEKQYNDILKGENGGKIAEVDVKGEIQSENIINPPLGGEGLYTTVDSRIQGELFRLIENLARSQAYNGGAGIIMDLRDGGIISSVSYPEYNAEILSRGKEKEIIDNYLSDKRKVFLDRTISGLYTPGSIIKPFLALGALAENIIDPAKKILSTGSISIPNPYRPGENSVFKDWRVNGWTDMRQALAVSSDIYFYTIGGGFEDQRGLGIVNIEKYIRLFGIGEKTDVDLPDEKSGTIPNPEWKMKNFAGDPWRIGDTYNSSIGQYGWQVTPIQMLRAIAAIGNDGRLLEPHFVLDKNAPATLQIMNLLEKDFAIVREGMRQAVSYGTAIALNVPYVEVAAKTGTAQVGVSKNKVNSWVVGFWPVENPKYAFTVMMESGPSSGATGATSVMRGLLDWMSQNAPEYLK